MEETKNKGTQAGAEGATEEGSKTYTQEEVEALIQKEADKRVTSALQKQAEKNAAETKAKMREAEKLAAMNEQQKYEYELEQREQKIKEKERELTLAENKAEASKILGEKGLSLDLVDLVVAEDAETMNANIATLNNAFDKSVKTEVEKRLGSSSPKKNLPPDQAVTREIFAKMGIAERQDLFDNNPDLYRELSQRKE